MIVDFVIAKCGSYRRIRETHRIKPSPEEEIIIEFPDGTIFNYDSLMHTQHDTTFVPDYVWI